MSIVYPDAQNCAQHHSWLVLKRCFWLVFRPLITGYVLLFALLYPKIAFNMLLLRNSLNFSNIMRHRMLQLAENAYFHRSLCR